MEFEDAPSLSINGNSLELSSAVTILCDAAAACEATEG